MHELVARDRVQELDCDNNSIFILDFCLFATFSLSNSITEAIECSHFINLIKKLRNVILIEFAAIANGGVLLVSGFRQCLINS